MSDRRRAFTLFEVMAAVAVLGFAVTMLARGAIAGMGYEGDASRRLAASLIADRALFEVESAFALGAVPEIGRQESETEDEFRLAVEVAPLDPAALGIGALFATDPAAGARAGAAAGAPPAQGNAPTLLLVSVRVAWTEGLTEQAVTRTTFAFDATAAAAALGSQQEGEASATATPAPTGRMPSAPGGRPGRARQPQESGEEEP